LNSGNQLDIACLSRLEQLTYLRVNGDYHGWKSLTTLRNLHELDDGNFAEHAEERESLIAALPQLSVLRIKVFARFPRIASSTLRTIVLRCWKSLSDLTDKVQGFVDAVDVPLLENFDVDVGVMPDQPGKYVLLGDKFADIRHLSMKNAAGLIRFVGEAPRRLKSLTTQIIADSDIHKWIYASLTSLDFEIRCIPPAPLHIQCLSELSNLKELTLSGCTRYSDIPIEELADLSSLSSLTKLTIKDSLDVDKETTPLKLAKIHATSLWLTLNFTRVGLFQPGILATVFHSVRELRLRLYSLSHSHLSSPARFMREICRLPHIADLTLDDMRVDTTAVNEDPANWRFPSTLRVLRLSEVRFETACVIGLLEQLPILERLILKDEESIDAQFSLFCRDRRIRFNDE
jgi:hypothetical protein